MKTLHMIGASAAISMALGGPAMSDGFDWRSLYVGGAVGWDYADYDSGGFNTQGAFNNTNDDHDGSSVGSLFVGLDDIVSFGPVSLRAELEGMGVGSKDIVTDSFAPPNPTFFYDTSVRTYAGLVNLWADVRPFSDFPVVLSVGGGVGIAHHKIDTGDGVVAGDGSDTQFAYAIGGQVAYEFAPTVAVGVMGRYTDFGKPKIHLKTIPSGASAGSYSLDQSGAQVMGFVRFFFGAD